MTNLTCKTYRYNNKQIETAENDVFLWDDSIERESLLHKASGKYIYQATWIENGKMTVRVDDKTFEEWQAFWIALKAEQEKAKKTDEIEVVIEKSSWWHINEFGERELNEDY